MIQCKCISNLSFYNIVEEFNSLNLNGGLFTFFKGNDYDLEITTHEFWGDTYRVFDNITGFDVGLSKDKFYLSFELIN